jgi:hypothetical protein
MKTRTRRSKVRESVPDGVPYSEVKLNFATAFTNGYILEAKN